MQLCPFRRAWWVSCYATLLVLTTMWPPQAPKRSRLPNLVTCISNSSTTSKHSHHPLDHHRHSHQAITSIKQPQNQLQPPPKLPIISTCKLQKLYRYSHILVYYYLNMRPKEIAETSIRVAKRFSKGRMGE